MICCLDVYAELHHILAFTILNGYDFDIRLFLMCHLPQRHVRHNDIRLWIRQLHDLAYSTVISARFRPLSQPLGLSHSRPWQKIHPVSHTHTIIRFTAWKSAHSFLFSNTEDIRDFFSSKTPSALRFPSGSLFTSSSFCLNASQWQRQPESDGGWSKEYAQNQQQLISKIYHHHNSDDTTRGELTSPPDRHWTGKQEGAGNPSGNCSQMAAIHQDKREEASWIPPEEVDDTPAP